jgi:cold shock CspA family protein
MGGPRAGRVTAFDARRGLGEVAEEDGAPYPFHATAIADGTRSIEVGAAVTFLVGPGQGGRYEARSVLPSAPSRRT